MYVGKVESALPLPTRRRHAPYWIAAILLTLVLHALLIFSHIPQSWIFWGGSTPPPPVRINQVDPAKLEQIRKQWRRERQKSLLLNKDLSPAKPSPDNPDARYLSDRNRRVEREQRARENTAIPHSAPPPRTRPRSERMRPLSALGVPMPLRNREPEPPREEDQRESGDQYVKDPTLPEGDQNLLNTQESVYYSFYARIYEAVAPRWQSRMRELLRNPQWRRGEYVTHMEAILDEDGTLVDTVYTQSSGITAFDEVASETWRRIGRFPNPPRGLLNEKRQVRIGFSYTVTVSLQPDSPIQFSSPQRTY